MLELGFRETLLISFLTLFPILTILASRKESKKGTRFPSAFKSIVKIIILISFFACLSSTVFTMVTGTRTSILLYLMPSLVGGLVVSLGFKDPPYKLIVPITFSLIPMIISSSLSVHGYFPIGQDEGYHTAYAGKILKEGIWAPGKYPIHSYYQWFPVISGSKAIIGLITGMGILRQVHSCLVIFVSSLFPMFIYLSFSRVLKSRRAGVLGAVLASSIPLFSTLGVIPQNLDYLIYMIFLFVFSFYLWNSGKRKTGFIVALLLFVSGIITHPTFFMTAAATIFAVIFAGIIYKRISTLKYRKIFLILIVISFAYWTHLHVLDATLVPLKQGLMSLADVLFGKEAYAIPTAHFFSAATPNYLAYSWAFLPAVSFSFLTIELKEYWGGKRTRMSLFSIVLTLIGISFMGFIFLDASLTGLGIGRYFYAGTIVAMVGASLHLKGIVSQRKRILSLCLIAGLVAISSFSALRTPALSPDVHEKVVPTKGSKPMDWKITNNFMRKMTPGSEINLHGVPGLRVPKSYYMPKYFAGVQSRNSSTKLGVHKFKEKDFQDNTLVYRAGKYAILVEK